MTAVYHVITDANKNRVLLRGICSKLAVTDSIICSTEKSVKEASGLLVIQEVKYVPKVPDYTIGWSLQGEWNEGHVRIDPGLSCVCTAQNICTLDNIFTGLSLRMGCSNPLYVLYQIAKIRQWSRSLMQPTVARKNGSFELVHHLHNDMHRT